MADKKEDQPKFSIGLSEPMATALGTVAETWAWLELSLDLIIWSLAEVNPENGACITAQLPNVSRRLYAFASLVDRRGPSDILRKRIARFIDETNKLARKRNRAIHDAWGKEPGEEYQGYRLEITAEMKLSMGAKPVKATELLQLAIDIMNHKIEFSKICDRIDAELGTSTRTVPGLHHRTIDRSDHR